MDGIHVAFESLQTGEDGIQSSYLALQQTLDQLGRDLQPMIGSWSGAAQEAYLTGKLQWDEAALELAQLLRTIGVGVGEAHDNYTRAESAATHLWS